MDWARIARLLDTPVDKLVARMKRHESRLDAWQKRMDEHTKELERLTGQLREAIERRKKLVEKVRVFDDRAETALRAGDEAAARAILIQKQDTVKQMDLAKRETDAWLSAVRTAREKLEQTKAEASALLAAEGISPELDPNAPKVRIKTE